MKKYISILATIVMLMSLVPQVSATDTSALPQHIAYDFDAGWDIDAAGATLTANSTATRTTQDTCDSSAGALEFTTTDTNGTLSFPIGAIDGNTYNISLWVKMNETPLTQDATFVIYTKTADYAQTAYITASHTEAFEKDKWVQVKAYYKHIKESGVSGVPEEGTIAFRLGDGNPENSMSGGTVTYTMDNFFVMPAATGSTAYDINVQTSGYVLTNGATVTPSFSGKNGQFIYRVVHELEDGDHYIKAGVTADAVSPASISVAANNTYRDGKVRVDVFGIDSNGVYSRMKSVYLPKKVVVYEDTITMRADQYVWTPDLTELSATVTYDNKTDTETLMTIAALYDANDNLLAVAQDNVKVLIDEEKTWQTTVNVVSDAVKAKFFAWYKDSMAPATDFCELTKTTDGIFIYVDANSTASTENGSYATPYKTFESARTAVQNVIANAKDTYVLFKSGEYALTDSVTLTEANGDCSSSKQVIYSTLAGDKATISGATHISGADFEPYDSTKGIYRASVPAGTKTRQLYVNGIKATRARSGEDTPSMTRASSYISVPKSTGLLDTAYPNELEVHILHKWSHKILSVDTITQLDSSSSDICLNFTTDGNKTNWGSMYTTSSWYEEIQPPVYLENALELLDEEGEWYLDTHENFLYYKPRAFETISTADFAIPRLERLIRLGNAYTTTDAQGNKSITVNGTAANIAFKNLEFAYTTWNAPADERAFVPTQNAQYNNDTVGKLMPGAVESIYSSNVDFDNCTFKNIGSIGLEFRGRAANCDITGNEFYQISGTALALGDPDGLGVPNDGRGYVITDCTVANNYIHTVATDYYGAAALSASFPKNTVIRNNEICDTPYSAMHIGWYWDDIWDDVTVDGTGEVGGSLATSHTENFEIKDNYIHDVMNYRLYDGGAIYTLGATAGTADNPNKITGNYIKDMKNMQSAIYTDEFSNGYLVSDNVVDLSDYPTAYRRYNPTGATNDLDSREPYWAMAWTDTIHDIIFKNNYSTTATKRNDGTNVTMDDAYLYPTAQWPQAALDIIAKAGIEKEYRNRFDFGVQMLTTPTLITMTNGATQVYSYTATTTKEKACDLSGYEIYVTSSNPDVVTADATTLTAKSAGYAWITVRYIKLDGDVVKDYGEHTFCVKVS